MIQKDLNRVFNRYKNVIVVGSILLAAVFLLFKEFNMYQTKFKSLNYKFQQVKAKKELISQIERKEARLRNIEGRLLPGSLLNFKQAVEKLARISKVDIISLRPIEEKKQNPYYQQIGLDLKLSASYGSFVNFIKGLERSSIEIEKVSIKRSVYSKQAGPLAIRLYVVGIMKKERL